MTGKDEEEALVQREVAQESKNVLITLANSKLGNGIIDAFLSWNLRVDQQQNDDNDDDKKQRKQTKYNLFGTSRDPNSPTLLEKGVTPIEFEFGNARSIENALEISQASIVIIITAWNTAANKNSQTEFHHSRVIIDACMSSSRQDNNQKKIEHVFYMSAFACDEVPKSVDAFQAKHLTERYLYGKMGETEPFYYSIIRCSSFLDNYNDPYNSNPLKRGQLVGLYNPKVPVASVACLNIGKAVLKMMQDPETWGSGQILHAISTIVSGIDCAVALSEVSDTKCKYNQFPIPIIWMTGLLPLVNYVNKREGHAFTREVEWKEEFHELLDEKGEDTVDATKYFESIGIWSDGTKFGTEVPSWWSSFFLHLFLQVPGTGVVSARVVAATSDDDDDDDDDDDEAADAQDAENGDTDNHVDDPAVSVKKDAADSTEDDKLPSTSTADRVNKRENLTTP